jgi:MOSC domain-containing protein YiiM
MHRSLSDLTEALEYILGAPESQGHVEMIAVRPEEDQRELLPTGKLDPDLGLVGDTWKARNAAHRENDRSNQLTLMNSRVIEHLAGTRDRWALAGDQIYVDMNLSIENLPPGTRLRLGDAIIEVSDQPHTGCNKFASRFGAEALRFVNTGIGRESRFRGINTFVVQGGEFSLGSPVVKLPDGAE